MNSGKIEEFYGKITTRDDIGFMLTYVPQKGGKDKKKKLKVTVKNKNYIVFYDDGKRGSYFREMVKKKPTETPQIRIDHVAFNGRFLTFVVSGFKMVEQEPITRLPVRLQVFNRRSQRIYDGVETFTIKNLKTNKVKLQVVFPNVPAGLYDVLIRVGDPLTGKNDLVIKEINILAPRRQAQGSGSLIRIAGNARFMLTNGEN
jgi:hypothetical protein